MEPRKKIFITYARDDREIVERITYALRSLGCDVWVDDSLTGGQVWWDVILEQIRLCDAVFATVSPSMLRSAACREEIDYARRVGRAVVPILVVASDLQILPTALAEVQLVDITTPDFGSGIRLASAIAGIRRATPTDQLILPEPPLAPVSYLSHLIERALSNATLSRDDQLAIVVARLEDGVANESDWNGIEHVANVVLEREDTLRRTAIRLEKILHEVNAVE